MRFISRSPRYKIEAIGQKWDTLANGQTRELAPGTIAEFRQEALFPWEEKAARAHFQFTGTTEEDANSGIMVDPIGRVSVFDTIEAQRTYGWTDEHRITVEENLLKARSSGQNGMDYIMVEKPAIPKPWPSYDETHHSKIAGMVEELGLNKADVLAYERDNKDRPSVIEALEGIEEPTVVSA